jgi:hypothetical protein
VLERWYRTPDGKSAEDTMSNFEKLITAIAPVGYIVLLFKIVTQNNKY